MFAELIEKLQRRQDLTVDEAERAWASALDRYFVKRVA